MTARKLKPRSSAMRAVVSSIVAIGALSITSKTLHAQIVPDWASSNSYPVVEGPEIWKDVSKTPQERARDLIRRLTIEEKASQILANPQPIERLGILAYSHRNEATHGVSSGNATVFPHGIGMAATFNPALIKQEADVIATEGRAKYNDFRAKNDGNVGERFGINFYAPNINIFRDPRWGRGQETYGEDPLLTSLIGVAFVQGLQGDDPKYIKAAACAKHYVVHSGPESTRHVQDANPSDRDFYETYLPAFEALVKDAKVETVMSAYSSFKGIPCSASDFLLNDVLRREWGFNGVVISDGGAIGDIWAEHHFVNTPEEACAAAIKGGCDVSSGSHRMVPKAYPGVPGHINAGVKGGLGFSVIPECVRRGMLTVADVDQALERELVMRFKLGIFDPKLTPWANVGMDQVDSAEHRALALKVAQQSIVLLKNENNALPLDRSKIKKIAVIGPNGDSPKMQNGSYAGRAENTVSILKGIQTAVGKDVEVTFVAGCPLTLRVDKQNAPKPEETAAAVAAANGADVVIFASGIDSTLEKEEADPNDAPVEGFIRGDRSAIELPAVQTELLKAITATGKPVVIVNCSGSAIAFPDVNAPAILQAWYPGEEGGTAVAQILFGDVNPSGRLPVTIYAATSDLPKFEDYSMANRTYRYFTDKPQYAFGHGLSYSKFEYANPKLELLAYASSETIKLKVNVKNADDRDGDEVVQVYYRNPNAADKALKQSLCSFARVSIAKGATADVTIEIPAARLRHYDEAKKAYVVESGTYELMIGSASDDVRVTTTLTVK